MKTGSQCIQGQFPGGRPHRSVIVNNSAAGALIQKKRNSQIFLQKNNNDNAFKIQPNRLNFRDSGVPLPKGVLQKMESVFDTDFSNVRIHTGGYQAESIGAMAFTKGNDIYFAQGQYNPHSYHGQRLLGHELTHVVQQRSRRVANPFGNELTVINDPGLEAEAERMKQKVNIPAKQFNNSRSQNIVQMAKIDIINANQLINSFETEVNITWRHSLHKDRVKFLTGDGGPTKDGTTAMDVGVTMADFNAAVATIKTKTYTAPDGSMLAYYKDGPSSKGGNIYDIIFSTGGQNPNDPGVRSINYHILIV